MRRTSLSNCLLDQSALCHFISSVFWKGKIDSNSLVDDSNVFGLFKRFYVALKIKYGTTFSQCNDVSSAIES